MGRCVWRLARVTLGATLSVPGKTTTTAQNNYWPGQSLIPACQRAWGVRVRRLGARVRTTDARRRATSVLALGHLGEH
ncbi:hypothetical protein EDB84DRAFT_1554943, partial [Lactarius hengduanensis]